MATKKKKDFYRDYPGWINPPKVAGGGFTYPADLDTNNSDHITFGHFPYDTNMRMKGGNREASYPPTVGNSITLYMPNSTPANGLKQKWEDKTFLGAAGLWAKSQIANVGSGLKNGIQAAPDGGEAASQIALDMMMKQVNQDAGTALALGEGKAYNPNVEMIYRQPLLRDFTFTFVMSPKNKADTAAIDGIVMEFKKWSAPSLQNKSHMLIPHLWMVQYKMAGGAAHDRMGAFKPMAVTEVTVQDNPSQDMHMSFTDGTPVVTAVSVSMTEIDIIVQEDHKLARGM